MLQTALPVGRSEPRGVGCCQAETKPDRSHSKETSTRVENSRILRIAGTQSTRSPYDAERPQCGFLNPRNRIFRRLTRSNHSEREGAPVANCISFVAVYHELAERRPSVRSTLQESTRERSEIVGTGPGSTCRECARQRHAGRFAVRRRCVPHATHPNASPKKLAHAPREVTSGAAPLSGDRKGCDKASTMLQLFRAALGAAILMTAFAFSSRSQAAPTAAGTPSPESSAREPSVEPADSAPEQDSPRVAVETFLRLCRDEQFQRAARFLDLSLAHRSRGAELARRFRFVLERHEPIDPNQLSPKSSGSDNDGLPPNVDRVTEIQSASGRSESIRLVRLATPIGPNQDIYWVFSAATVSRIDHWYENLDHRWAFETLPPILLKTGPAGILFWQWLALPCLGLVAWLLGMLLARISNWLLARAARRTSAAWDDQLVPQLRGPLRLAWTLISARLGLPWLALHARAESSLETALRAGLFLAFFWTLLRGLSLLAYGLTTSAWATGHPASRSLVPIGTRVAKVLVFLLAIVAMLAEFGYPVASLIAGLGIGGLAVALAAQKTVENLFGAFSLGVDQPFREGDFVRIEDFVGTVEAIGLRSTRIRTLDRTVISIPNGKLAEMRLESFSERDRIRLHCRLGVVYETTADQMRLILEDLERVLRAHPKTWQEAMTVRFEAFGASSLDIEIMVWFMTTDFDEFKLIRQTINLEFMRVVEKHGSSFAFPTRTVHLAGTPWPASPGDTQRAADKIS